MKSDDISPLTQRELLFFRRQEKLRQEMSNKPELSPEQRSLVVQARREIERVYSGSLTLGTDLETAVERVLAELVSRVLQEAQSDESNLVVRCPVCDEPMSGPDEMGYLSCPTHGRIDPWRR